MAEAQLSAPRRRTWFHITIGVTLLLVAVLLTVGWQFIASEEAPLQASPTARYLVYFRLSNEICGHKGA